MKSRHLSHAAACLFTVLMLTAGSGCYININDSDQGYHGNQVQFEKTVTEQVAPSGADTLDVLSRAGSITITGTDATDCSIEAKIVARAPSDEEAQELAEQVEIRAEVTESTLKVRSHEPDMKNNRSISVSYTISAPRRMGVKCNSSYGSLSISDMEGRLDGESGNGSIKVRDIQGQTDLHTSYGSIECRNVAGPSISLRSNNGSIDVAQLRGSTTAESTYGSIHCEDFSDGDLHLKSGNGRVAVSNASFGVCNARSSYGAIAANALKGESVELKSGNGNVEADGVEVKTLALSSSYGSIRATEVTAADIQATSGNGSVRIACTPAAPSDLSAQVRSSYGSIEFISPPEFSGEVYLSTSYGTIRTALPVTVTGELTKTKVAGQVGQGTGKIRLESGNGSVELK